PHGQAPARTALLPGQQTAAAARFARAAARAERRHRGRPGGEGRWRAGHAAAVRSAGPRGRPGGLSGGRRHSGAAGRGGHRHHAVQRLPAMSPLLDLPAALAASVREGLEAPPVTAIEADVRRALDEDIGSGDLSAALLPPRTAQARIIAREEAVVCGLPWALRCFAALDPGARFHIAVPEGERSAADAEVLRIEADVRALVSAERCALNCLQTLSGTATATSVYVDAVAGTGLKVLDTRKTLPGLRLAQKYAVRAGGGANHRTGLYDAVLIKENHIAAAGSIAAAVARARERGAGRFI